MTLIKNTKRVILNVTSLPISGESKYLYNNTTDGLFYSWNTVTNEFDLLSNLTPEYADNINNAPSEAKEGQFLYVTSTGDEFGSINEVYVFIGDVWQPYPSQSITSKIQHEVKLAENINAGQAVYVSSANGTNMIVSKASNATEGTSSKTLGLLITSGVTNEIRQVVTEGLQEGFDTSTANAGDPVWLGTNGNLIFGLTNKPKAPAHLVYIGVVTRVNQNNGEIFVKVQNGFELEELHNVIVSETIEKDDTITYDADAENWKSKKIIKEHTFDRYVSTDGNNTDGTGTKSYPFLTIAKALTGAQFPLALHLEGQTFTENVSLVSGQSNINLHADNSIRSRQTTILSGTITTATGFTRLGLKGLIFSSGTSVPITLGSGDAGRHSFENVSFQTTNANLISINANFSNWLNFYNCDFSGSASSVLTLPNLSGQAVLRLYDCGSVNISVGNGWTVYTNGDTVLNHLSIPSVNSLIVDLKTVRVVAVITSQAQLTTLLGISSGVDGAYIINFASPTGITGLGQGDIILKVGAAQGIIFKFVDAPASVIQYLTISSQITWVKSGLGWASAFVNGGNSFGANATMGTNDNFDLLFETNGTEKARLTKDGLLGVGIDTPDAKVSIKTTAARTNTNTNLITSFFSTTGRESFIFHTYNAAANAPYTGWQGDNGSTLALQPFLGRVGIGLGSAITKLQVYSSEAGLYPLGLQHGSSFWRVGPESQGGPFVVYGGSNGFTGVYMAFNGTGWTANSDEKLKDIDGHIEDALTKVLGLRTIYFKWKDKENNEKQNVGFIAQDIQKVLPEIVTEKDGILGVEYATMTVLLAASIKELSAKVDELTERIKILEETKNL